MNTTTKNRDKFVKLSLTEKEFLALSELSEQLDNTLAGTVRELITVTSELSILITQIFEYIDSLPKEEKDKIEAVEKALPKEQRLSKMAMELYFLRLRKFSIQWDKSDIQERFKI